jgi:5-formyltetrahydrofolate cyclo-ligase
MHSGNRGRSAEGNTLATIDEASDEKNTIRSQIWSELRKVAYPDSRFHWDFSSFIADYHGSDLCAQRIRELPAWQDAQSIFITPDNNLEPLRRGAMDDGKSFVMSTYGIARGFLYLDAQTVPPADRGWAATLDGMNRFGQLLTLVQLMRIDPFDVLVTGASAISMDGTRFGKGHGYFDLEWAMFSEVGHVAPNALVVAVGHDCQIVDVPLPASEFDAGVDLIVTPTRTIPVDRGSDRRPGRVVWEKLEAGMEERIPPLQELRQLQSRR